jgi:hypothetical protein
MYNPASIVDLRRNSSFTMTNGPNSGVADFQGSFLKVEKSITPLTGLQSPAMSGAQTPMSGIRINESSLFHIPPSRYSNPALPQSCNSCENLRQQFDSLEARQCASEERFLKFEQQVLSVLRGISNDLREIKAARDTPSIGNSLNRITPPPLDLGSMRRATQKSTVSNNQNSSQTPELDYTRDAIAEACVALERLVADARNRSGFTGRYP